MGTATAIYPVTGAAIYSNNTSIADFVSGSTVEAFAPGSTTIEAYWETGYYTMEGVGYEECYWVPVFPQPEAPVAVAPIVQITEVGFTGDHQMTKWPATTPANVIDNPDGSAPTWKSTANPNDPVAYTKGSMPTMFAKLSVTPTAPNRNAKLRVRNGSTVIANKDIVIGGSSVNVTGISTNSALESTVKTTTPTFTWEVSFNDGATWSSIGSSGPHTMYWTYASPLATPFANDFGSSYNALYDEALAKATGYVNGSSDLNTIIDSINNGVQSAVYYMPAGGLGNQHPLDAYSSPFQGNCSDHSHLLRGLLRSIGINGTMNYIWAGPNSSTLIYYQRYTTPQTPSFQITKGPKEGAEENPHFAYHAVVKVNNNWYDPSYGEAPSSIFTFAETANNNQSQQIREAKWSTMQEVNPSFSCPHPTPSP